MIEGEMGVDLSHIGAFSLDERVASTRNCENMIGATQIPLGIAGPLQIKVERLKLKDTQSKLLTKNTNSDNLQLTTYNYFVPLATTEGALVASVNRGCKAIFESGGATVDVEHIGVTRGPVFRVKNSTEGALFAAFLKDRFVDIAAVSESTSSHLKLLRFEETAVGLYRYVRFYFDTQDAMGLNMITIATEKIAQFIESEIGIACLDISGNFCVDKKPSYQNFIRGRGYMVRAEITVPGEVVLNVLKTTPEKIYESWLAKCMIGSAVSGSLGYNAQYANIVAALGIATGQDPAHVVEGSMGITTVENVKSQSSNVKSNDLYMSVYLPSVLVGTVGGGTGLATQREALSIMGISGGNDGKNARTLAAILGGAVLAGELSLLSSLAEGSLARAHQTLARGKV